LVSPGGHHHNITRDAFERLKGTISLTEVENTLGGPAGDYGPGNGEIVEQFGGSVTSSIIKSRLNRKDWLARDIAVSVWFDNDGHPGAYSLNTVYRPWKSYKDLLLQTIGAKAPTPVPVWVLIQREAKQDQ
jgi:hypothetical protein